MCQIETVKAATRKKPALLHCSVHQHPQYHVLSDTAEHTSFVQQVIAEHNEKVWYNRVMAEATRTFKPVHSQRHIRLRMDRLIDAVAERCLAISSKRYFWWGYVGALGLLADTLTEPQLRQLLTELPKYLERVHTLRLLQGSGGTLGEVPKHFDQVHSVAVLISGGLYNG